MADQFQSSVEELQKEIAMLRSQLQGKEREIIALKNNVLEKEEMVTQSEKMMSIGGLAAGMAHEINNPLAGILQNIQVIKHRLSPNVSINKKKAEECGTCMDMIHAYLECRDITTIIDAVLDSSARASEIVANLLGFSEPHREMDGECNIQELLDKTIDLVLNDFELRKLYPLDKVQFEKHYDANPINIWCDSSKIQHVFFNIFKNGIQSMYGAPSPRFGLTVTGLPDKVRIVISDNGPGMSDDVKKRALEPFFTTREVGKGLGLGLTVSYFIVTESHKGVFEIDTSPSGGAQFVIMLPLHR